MTKPSWAVLDEKNFHYSYRIAKVRAEYEMWRSALPITDVLSHEDWTMLSTVLYSELGEPKHRQARFLDALECLDRLPKVKAMVEETWLLDMNQLSAIESAVCEAPVAIQDDDFFWEALDDDLMDRFTPSRPRQLTPSNSTIRKTVKATILSLEDAAIPDPEVPAPEDGPTPCENPGELLSSLPPVEDQINLLQVEDLADGQVRFDLTVDQATGTLIADAVKKAAAEQECSQANAMVGLILGQITSTVITNIYRASDVPDAPAFHADRGILTRESTAILEEFLTKTRDMDEAQDLATLSYETTPAIRALLIGRDWICRWPGCNRKAVACDADHRINHADGGPTTAANMIMLCRHHHNRKTDRQIFYLIDHPTGDVYWFLPDGSWVVDEATGPLAPKQKRWVQTFHQRRLRRRERLAAQAAAERYNAYRGIIEAPPEPTEPRHYLPWRKPPDVPPTYVEA
ncbi:MAG: HNH endonuclease signature motif containing protein [Corynebacterium sp.]|uniref:HNH endonuclease signature motif containing protein n=1 Tax=Corynebacterium sp. TaxID=1720 RepID=UPI0026DF9FE8|nr:HNH endonuclease signature motif containing protein [Corynebacterium sp.]MDO5669299.1 HNH endonuclease signature motif containing protein [Corynebacterium sp.]